MWTAAVAARAGEGDGDLAFDLFCEGDWKGCHTECLRTLVMAPGDARATLLKGAAALRDGRDAVTELRRLAATPGVTSNIVAMASFETGRFLVMHGRDAEAVPDLVLAFRAAADHALFLRAGCLLHGALSRNPVLAESHRAAWLQAVSCRALWTDEIRSECSPGPEGDPSGWLSRPPQWMIAFYRSQIRPLLGRRCSLSPSCSEYCRQALRKHGLLGLAMYADRAVREPQVVAQGRQTTVIDGYVHYLDLLEDHDGWMGKGIDD